MRRPDDDVNDPAHRDTTDRDARFAGDGDAFTVPAGCELVSAIDALVAGVHFPDDAAPADVGHKALAVNLSDLAAVGATPSGACLSLVAPDAHAAWLDDFADGYVALAAEHGVRRHGFCRSRGALCVAVAVFGHVPEGEAVCRAGAHPGDAILVTGTLGDAGLALAARRGEIRVPDARHRAAAEDRLGRPRPRVAAGRALRGLATAAIDVSDGLVADLGHVLAASGTGATLTVERLPLSEALRALPEEVAWRLALASGDDYELCFSVVPQRVQALERRLDALGCPHARIGTMTASGRLEVVREDGSPFAAESGYRHFP